MEGAKIEQKIPRPPKLKRKRRKRRKESRQDNQPEPGPSLKSFIIPTGCLLVSALCFIFAFLQQWSTPVNQGKQHKSGRGKIIDPEVAAAEREILRRKRDGRPLGTPLRDARWEAELRKSGGVANCAAMDDHNFTSLKEDGLIDIPSRPSIRWTHIPKTGQSFAYTIMNHGCPLINLEKMHFLVDDYRRDQYQRGEADPSLNSFMQRVLNRRGCQYRAGPLGICPHVALPIRGHIPVKPEHFGQIVTMLRDPHQRLISSAFMGTGCNKALRTLNFTQCIEFKYLTERGCYTRFFNGELCSLDSPGKARCQGERLDKCVVSATKVLLNGGIRFAGITEWWDASICLFHAISGGDPHDVQFKNIHPGSGSSAKQDGLYDASILLGKVDAHDLFIYEKAKERFRDLWERHRDKLPGHARCQELSKNTTFGAKVSEIAK